MHTLKKNLNFSKKEKNNYERNEIKNTKKRIQQPIIRKEELEVS